MTKPEQSEPQCNLCEQGIGKAGEYLHDLTPTLAPDETHTYYKCKAAPESLPLARWRPIETAPKTGESLLLGHGNAVWEDEWYSPELNWLEVGRGGSRYGEVPTHWMPLPAPPDTLNLIEKEAKEKK